MVGHDYKFMKSVGCRVTIMKESFDQDFRVFADLEDGAALPASSGDEVRGAWRSSVLRC